jgi:O-acetyl-ADP-ribose deacetylase (regulator of RNase III)
MYTMLPDRIVLVARDPALDRAWRHAFADQAGVEVVSGDYFDHPADAMVSPANSFGIMDGGLDLAIRDQLGLEVQRRVQRAIVDHHHGELPVGAAVIVETDDPRWPHLVAAPTMRVPERVAGTLNAYHAFRAVLLEIKRWNARVAAPIRSLVCCGLGTGIGGMEPTRCALQMRLALRQVRGPARIPSFAMIHAEHEALKTQ